MGDGMQNSVKTESEVKVLEFKGKLDTQAFLDAQDQLSELIEKGEMSPYNSMGRKGVVESLERLF
jgi:hypothetical protein